MFQQKISLRSFTSRRSLLAILAIALISITAVGSGAAGFSFLDSVNRFFGVGPAKASVVEAAPAGPAGPLSVTPLTTWANIYHSVTAPTTVATQFAVPAGSNRMLVVVLSYEDVSGGFTLTLNAPEVTYGGITMTPATANDGGTSSSKHSLIYYLKDTPSVMNAANHAVVVDITGTAAASGTLLMSNVWWAVYTGVNQTPTVTSLNLNTVGTNIGSGNWASNLTIPAGGIGVLAVTASVCGGAPTYTPPTNWLANGTQVDGTSGLSIVGHDFTAGTTDGAFTGTSCRWSETGMTIAPLVTTAAAVNLSGRVLSANGRGIPNAQVALAGNSLGQTLTTITNAFGYYQFNNLTAGQTFVVTVQARRYTFKSPSNLVSLSDNLTGFNFVANQ